MKRLIRPAAIFCVAASMATLLHAQSENLNALVPSLKHGEALRKMAATRRPQGPTRSS